MKLDYLSTAVTACCILHNICEVHHDEFDEQWQDDVNDSSIPSSSGSTLPTLAQYISKSHSGNIHGGGNNLTKRDSDYILTGYIMPCLALPKGQ